MKIFEMQASDRDHIMLTDDLFATYMEYCHLGPDQVAIHVRTTYQFHVDMLNLSMNNHNDQPDDDGDGEGAQNQCSNVVLEPVETIQPPQDDRAARRVRRDAQRKVATAGTHDGNGGNSNGNGNVGGNGGGGGDDDGNGNGNDDGNDDTANNDGRRNCNNGNRNASGPADGDGDGDPNPDPPDNNSDDEDNDDEPDGFYMQRDLVLPRGIDPGDFDFNHECWKLRRDLHLCDIPDSYHAKIFIYGGLYLFERLSTYNYDAWTKQQMRALRWNHPVSFTSFQVERLTTISRWVLVKIVYGVDINVDELTKDNVSRIVTEEICEEADPVDLEPPALGQSHQYPKWKKAMIRHLKTIRTKDSVRLPYVICTPERPAVFDSLLHELEYCLPIDGSTAANKRDQRHLYDILDFNMKDDNSRAWLTSKEHQHQGCSGWLALQDLHEGNNNYESCLSDLKERLEKQRYTGVSNNNASTLTARLYNIYTKFSRLDVTYLDIDKLRQLRNNIKMPSNMTDVWFIQHWRYEVDQALNNYRMNQTPIVFSDFTTRLINAKAQYLKDHKKDSTCISQASSGTRNHGGSVSGGNDKAYNPKTGEPYQWQIQGIYIIVLYGSVYKVHSDEFQYLPKITKKWFTAHSDNKCPPRFKTSKSNSNSNTSSNNNNKKKKSNRQVSAAEAESPPADGYDADELSSSTPL